MKKMKRFSMEPSPYAPSSSSSYPEGLEARARFRHQSLMQDFLELQKEIEAKRKKLLKANKKKRELLTVVKFLQKKVQSFSKKPSKKVQSRVKKQPLKLALSSNLYDKIPKDSQEVKVAQSRVKKQPLKLALSSNLYDKIPKDSQQVKVAPVPRATALLDLNQISLPNGEEMDEYQTELKALTVPSKRKISWQDQISVRV